MAQKPSFLLQYFAGICNGVFLLYLLVTPLFFLDEMRRMPEWFNAGVIFLLCLGFVKVVSFLCILKNREDAQVSRLLYTMLLVYGWLYNTNMSGDRRFEDIYEASDFSEMSLTVRYRYINSSELQLYSWLITIGVISALAVHSTLSSYEVQGAAGVGLFAILLGFGTIVLQDCQLPWIYYLAKLNFIQPSTLLSMNVKFLENSGRVNKLDEAANAAAAEAAEAAAEAAANTEIDGTQAGLSLTRDLAVFLQILGFLMITCGLGVVAQLWSSDSKAKLPFLGGFGSTRSAVQTAGYGALTPAQLARMRQLQKEEKLKLEKKKKSGKKKNKKNGESSTNLEELVGEREQLLEASKRADALRRGRYLLFGKVAICVLVLLFVPSVLYEVEMLGKARAKRGYDESNLFKAEMIVDTDKLLSRQLNFTYPISYQILRFLNVLMVLAGMLRHLLRVMRVEVKGANVFGEETQLPPTPPTQPVQPTEAKSEEIVSDNLLGDTMFFGIKPQTANVNATKAQEPQLKKRK